MRVFFMIVILVKCVFLGFPDKNIEPFLFPSESMRVMSAFQYSYAAMEITALFAIMVCFYLVASGKIKSTPERVRAITAYMLMVGFDWLDFFIRGNSEWFMIGTYPVTNNVFILPTYWLLTIQRESGLHGVVGGELNP